jgi:hypothetical protein
MSLHPSACSAPVFACMLTCLPVLQNPGCPPRPARTSLVYKLRARPDAVVDPAALLVKPRLQLDSRWGEGQGSCMLVVHVNWME